MNLLSHKGYNAAVEFDADDMLLVGRIAGINDVVGFHGQDAAEIVAAFHEALDDYLETCAALGKAPEVTSKSIRLRKWHLGPNVRRRASRRSETA